jgi:hypothetical protein
LKDETAQKVEILQKSRKKKGKLQNSCFFQKSTIVSMTSSRRSSSRSGEDPDTPATAASLSSSSRTSLRNAKEVDTEPQQGDLQADTSIVSSFSTPRSVKSASSKAAKSIPSKQKYLSKFTKDVLDETYLKYRKAGKFSGKDPSIKKWLQKMNNHLLKRISIESRHALKTLGKLDFSLSLALSISLSLSLRL